MNFAKNAFGSKNVRAVGLEDVSALNASMREAGKSESTRGKHLRVLHASSPRLWLTTTPP